MHAIYKMTAAAWERGDEWDKAIFNGDIEAVREFPDLNSALQYFENELGGDEHYFVF